MALVVYILKLRHLIPSHPSAPQASSPSSFFLQRFKENGKFDFKVGIFLLPIIVWAKLLLISWLFQEKGDVVEGKVDWMGRPARKGTHGGFRSSSLVLGMSFFFFFVAYISI